jgi:transglutaminase-like putative cysteine protease
MVFLNAQTNNSFTLAKLLFSWLKRNIQYQTHPDETAVRPAAVTLQTKHGDCDDLSFLYISLCRALGIPARFIRGYLLTENANGAVTATAHAWVEVFVGGSDSHNGWIPIECACVSSSIDIDIHQNFGVESAFHLRLFIDDGSNESLATSLTGISYVIRDPSLTINLQSFAEVQKYTILESRKLLITESNIRYYD